ncbi:hypothetical protein [Billgrantia kenyensis]|uniref:Uncharacterized protein n=1 Tax=Billgrantia kenyensis TaxID=321266 RepID=A0A7V9VYY2_9GAMM|nr:hypothetical protein [Halomonas kenyensis]MBA2778005.1 hypothetical protein [Halomonas kenyensis]MCG6661476.1 hypothetical protein [Halomonas kenyensis]
MQSSALQGFVAALVRCFSIYLGLTALRFAVQGVSFHSSDVHYLHLGYFVVTTLLFAGVAIVLWHFHSAVAGRLLPATGDDQAKASALSGVDFETGLIGAVGLYVAVTALPQLANHGAWLFYDRELLGIHRAVEGRAAFVGSLIQLGLGVLLLLRAPGIRRLVARLRTGGT